MAQPGWDHHRSAKARAHLLAERQQAMERDRRLAESRLAEQEHALVLGKIDDPKLPPNSVDLILLVDVYHEFSHPWEMTRAMVRALKPGGRLVLVEYRLEDPSVPIKRLHKMSEQQVRMEMAVHPIQWVETLAVLPWQHIIIFKK